MAASYAATLEALRQEQYPMLKDSVYLDHAGTTLYSKSLLERFTSSMMSGLYGNPHSASPSSQVSTSRIEDTRLKALRFFKADPEDFDLVFVANATAGIKLVMETFRGLEDGFRYAYHKDSHTSLVGVREDAQRSHCMDDEAVQHWLSVPAGTAVEFDYDLLAYPAQSNMDGRRLPLSWAEQVRVRNKESQSTTYSLLDAASLVSTAQLDLSDAKTAPDFVVLSFYKIFGFPDLGALIIRKDSGSVFQHRRYFGGGTVDLVLCVKEQWHVPKNDTVHDRLEDGTLPIHNILALDAAMDVHGELFESMDQIAKHTLHLAKQLYDGLMSLRHINSHPVCVLHSEGYTYSGLPQRQGPIVAFNIKDQHGAWVSNTEFEKLASVRKIHVRSGGLCNPGGVATCLGLEPWEMRKNFSAGFKCGSETDIYAGKITGVIRASVGAMSIASDVEALINFIKEFYVERDPHPIISPTIPASSSHLFVESLMIYPIKSCAGFGIPSGIEWEIKAEGLAWDREWFLVHQGTGQALSQKRYPQMALFRPKIDFEEGLLRVTYHGKLAACVYREVTVPLSADPSYYTQTESTHTRSSRVCGDSIIAQTYARPEISAFFSENLGVPCTLARFPAGGIGSSTRHSKAHLQKHQRPRDMVPNRTPKPSGGADTLTPPDSDNESVPRPILLSNESPILTINRSSLDALNREIAKSGGKPAPASVFRANVIIASSDTQGQNPYNEDLWNSLSIGSQRYQMLGSCRRCHMICIDQDTAEKNEEPFVTLAKTRRFDSKVFFGTHMCHVPCSETQGSQASTIRVGDIVNIGI